MDTLPAKPGFAERMAAVDAAIQRDRRPLPAHDLSGCNYRRWAAAVIHAELKHARDEFWRNPPANLPLDADGYVDRHADVAFRLPHEREAGKAAVWLSHLTTHDGMRYGINRIAMTRDERTAWARRKREVLHGFLRACAAYQAERAKVDAVPVARAA